MMFMRCERQQSCILIKHCCGLEQMYLCICHRSLVSVSAAGGGASADEREQNRPDCVGREASARDQVHLKPPLILQCAVELLYSLRTSGKHLLGLIVSRREPCYRQRPSKRCGAALSSVSGNEQGRQQPIDVSDTVNVWHDGDLKVAGFLFCVRGIT